MKYKNVHDGIDKKCGKNKHINEKTGERTELIAIEYQTQTNKT
jgi:hypothetical protein